MMFNIKAGMIGDYIISQRARLIFIVIICQILTACVQLDNRSLQRPLADRGVIDLRNWNFEKDGSVNLDGEWAFFWEKLLLPGQMASCNTPHYVSVPELWTDHDIHGDKITPKGYATYHLVVYLPVLEKTFAMYSEGQGSAYSLWIDSRLSAQNGRVGTNIQTMRPQKKPTTFFFKPEAQKLEIVLQISNFHHRKGGFRNNILLGLAPAIHQYETQNWFVEVFSIGIIFALGFYHFFIYIFRFKNKSSLYFAILCWTWVVRLIVINQNTFLFLLPESNWNLALRVEYLTFFLSPIIFCLFIRNLYPKDTHRWFVQTVISLGAIFSLFVIFMETYPISYSITYYQLVIVLQIIYYLFFLYQIIIRKREGAYYIGVAFAVTIATIIVEALHLQGFLLYGKVAYLGMLSFVFVQAILLAARFSKSFNRVEILSDKLEGMYISLQHSERKFRNIYEHSNDIIFITGMDAKVEEISPACEEVLGYTKEEFQNKNILNHIVDTMTRTRFQNDISNTGQVRNFEARLLRKDGKKIDALISAVFRHDNDGKVIGIQGSAKDITTKKQAEVERLRALKFQQIAITDPLTSAYNRRFFDEVSQKEVERAKRSGTPLSIVMIDVDFFKKINDTYGHLIGDKVLIKLVDLCLNNIRKMDLFARLGGEEFVILMPETDILSARNKAERLRKMVAKEIFADFENTDIKITISLGISHFNPAIPLEINTLLDHADKALYHSKKTGRNQVTVWEPGI